MPTATQQIRFCQSFDSTRIAYTIEGSGPPLVRVPHWLNHLRLDWDSPFWRPLLSVLMQRYTLVRYDLRGAGLSDREGAEISLEKHVEDLETIIEVAGAQRFALFAVTGGVHIALRYAARYPERVSHLVLYAGSTRGRMASGVARDIEECEAQLKLIELGWSLDNPAFRQLQTTQFIPDATPDQSKALTELMRLTSTPASAAALLRGFWTSDNRDIAPQIKCPTIVFHPREDPRIPFEQGRQLAALIPGARFVPLESRNHLLVENEQAWEQFIEALDSFLPSASETTDVGGAQFVKDLTAREFEVLELLAQGFDNSEIAGRLGTRAKTVRNQLSIIFSKLGVNSRGQAIIRARNAGLGLAQPSTTLR